MKIRKFAIASFTATALLLLSACTSSDDDATDDAIVEITSTSNLQSVDSTVNGFRLTSRVDTINGEPLRRVEINYSNDSNSYEWLNFNASEAVTFRIVDTFNEDGHLTRSEGFSSTGELTGASEYVVEDNLYVEQRRSDRADSVYEYTENGVILRHERTDDLSGLITNTVDYTHDSDGRLSTALSTIYVNNGTTSEPISTSTSNIEHNENGQLSVVDHDFGSIEYTYDDNGNVLQLDFIDLEGSVERRTHTYETTSIPTPNIPLVNIAITPEI